MVAHEQIRLPIGFVQVDAMYQLVPDVAALLRPNGLLEATGDVLLAGLDHLVCDLEEVIIGWYTKMTASMAHWVVVLVSRTLTS